MRCCRFPIGKAIPLILLLLFLGFMMVGFRKVRDAEFVHSTNITGKYDREGNADRNSEIHSQVRSPISLDDRAIIGESTSQPLLPEDRPDWVAQPDYVEGEIHHVAIGTELANTLEECRSKLDTALMTGMQRYIDEHLMRNQKVAATLPELNPTWIRHHLIEPDKEYAAVLERPAGTFHQLWVRLSIDSNSRATIEKWRQGHETKMRVGIVGSATVGCLVCLVVLNAGLNLLKKS